MGVFSQTVDGSVPDDGLVEDLEKIDPYKNGEDVSVSFLQNAFVL
jgi:hypothetical protein